MLGLVCFVGGLVCVVGVMLLFVVACLGDDDCCALFGGDVLVCMPAVSLGDLILGMGALFMRRIDWFTGLWCVCGWFWLAMNCALCFGD